MTMKLCVGAVSRRIVEEAAALGVHQIVASNAQVNVNGGYTGMTPKDLVDIVRAYDGNTEVVRDHGGPQRGEVPTQTDAVAHDVKAGFDGYHIDVCMMPRAEQVRTLLGQLAWLNDKQWSLEIGGEHDDQSWNDILYQVAIDNPTINVVYAVVSTGTHAWADKNYGTLRTIEDITQTVENLHAHGIRAKAHNFDHIPQRVERYGEILDAYNIAPEFGMVETRAILTALPYRQVHNLLVYAYETKLWSRWFKDNEGTWQERAECALRYAQTHAYVTHIYDAYIGDEEENYIRSTIKHALQAG
jgi:hypothetical protein